MLDVFCLRASWYKCSKLAASELFLLAFLLGSAGPACTLSHDAEAAPADGMAGSAARLLDAAVAGAGAEDKAAPADEAEPTSELFRLAFLLGSAGTACTISHDEEAAPEGGMAGSAAWLLDATVVGACAEVKAAS